MTHAVTALASNQQIDACLIALLGGPVSTEAKALVQHLLHHVVLPYRQENGAKTKAGARVEGKLEIALGALLADLSNLRRPNVRPVAGAHGMSPKDFPARSRLGFGRDAFRLVAGSLVQAGLLKVTKGYPRWGLPDDGNGRDGGSATCFELTPPYLQLASEVGVQEDGETRHWELIRSDLPKKYVPPLELRKKRVTVSGQKKASVAMPFDPSMPKPNALLHQMERINDLIVSQSIEGVAFLGLRRIFNNGDQLDFDWNKGGRFYSMPGSQRYEGWSAEDRCSRITFNREAVTEVDLRASHLTLLYALTGQPFDNSEANDPYALEDWPRQVAKLWIAQAIGSNNPLPARWSRTSEADFGKERPLQSLADQFPIREVGVDVRAKHPLLSDLRAHGITTLDLQYHEAEILRLAMEDLMLSQSVAALPMHDALIVPRSRVEEAIVALKAAFRNYVGEVRGEPSNVIPRVTLKELSIPED